MGVDEVYCVVGMEVVRTEAYFIDGKMALLEYNYVIKDTDNPKLITVVCRKTNEHRYFPPEELAPYWLQKGDKIKMAGTDIEFVGEVVSFECSDDGNYFVKVSWLYENKPAYTSDYLVNDYVKKDITFL